MRNIGNFNRDYLGLAQGYWVCDCRSYSPFGLILRQVLALQKAELVSVVFALVVKYTRNNISSSLYVLIATSSRANLFFLLIYLTVFLILASLIRLYL